MPALTIRPAAVTVAAAPSAFGAGGFAATFGANNTPGGTALHPAAELGAARLYKKCGFRRVGAHASTLGRDGRTSWIMVRLVGDAGGVRNT